MSRSGNRHGNEFVESLSSYKNVKGFRKDPWNWKGCSPRFLGSIVMLYKCWHRRDLSNHIPSTQYDN